MFWFNLLILLIVSVVIYTNAQLFENDPCTTHDNLPGKCVVDVRCTEYIYKIRLGKMSPYDMKRCGFLDDDELICCPTLDTINMRTTTSTTTTSTTTTTTRRPVLQQRGSATRACEFYKTNHPDLLHAHISNGVDALRNEFPHMAAIGYSDSLNTNYEFLCGGSLIHPKYILTAAHCVVRNGRKKPRIVRLGFVNFANTKEMNEAVTVNIAHIHSHPQYSSKHNDIAILELETAVQLILGRIMPACMGTDTENPDDEENYVITGWGRMHSYGSSVNNLQKANLKLDTIENCRWKYLNIADIADTNLCAYDPKNKRDACGGDSGGPLSKLINLEKSLYSIVGVTASGVGCGGRIPGIYTKVSDYLDYIEDIIYKDSDGSYTVSSIYVPI